METSLIGSMPPQPPFQTEAAHNRAQIYSASGMLPPDGSGTEQETAVVEALFSEEDEETG